MLREFNLLSVLLLVYVCPTWFAMKSACSVVAGMVQQPELICSIQAGSTQEVGSESEAACQVKTILLTRPSFHTVDL